MTEMPEDPFTDLDEAEMVHEEVLTGLIQKLLLHTSKASALYDHSVAVDIPKGLQSNMVDRLQREIDLATMYAKAVQALKPIAITHNIVVEDTQNDQISEAVRAAKEGG